jgi:hypothetical protein
MGKAAEVGLWKSVVREQATLVVVVMMMLMMLLVLVLLVLCCVVWCCVVLCCVVLRTKARQRTDCALVRWIIYRM